MERLVEDEVAAKGGLTGIAIKGAFKVVSTVKPGVIREALDHLLDDFVNRLDPLYQTHRASGGDARTFPAFLVQKKGEAADLLLGVTDERARRAHNKTLKGAYEKLRPQAKKHVEDAIPGAGRVFARHI
jgi:hypothetical protein